MSFSIQQNHPTTRQKRMTVDENARFINKHSLISRKKQFLKFIHSSPLLSPRNREILTEVTARNRSVVTLQLEIALIVDTIKTFFFSFFFLLLTSLRLLACRCREEKAASMREKERDSAGSMNLIWKATVGGWARGSQRKELRSHDLEASSPGGGGSFFFFFLFFSRFATSTYRDAPGSCIRTCIPCASFLRYARGFLAIVAVPFLFFPSISFILSGSFVRTWLDLQQKTPSIALFKSCTKKKRTILSRRSESNRRFLILLSPFGDQKSTWRTRRARIKRVRDENSGARFPTCLADSQRGWKEVVIISMTESSSGSTRELSLWRIANPTTSLPPDTFNRGHLPLSLTDESAWLNFCLFCRPFHPGVVSSCVSLIFFRLSLDHQPRGISTL